MKTKQTVAANPIPTEVTEPKPRTWPKILTSLLPLIKNPTDAERLEKLLVACIYNDVTLEELYGAVKAARE